MHSTEYENNNDCIVMRTLTLKSGFEFHSESKNFHLIFNWFIFKPWKKKQRKPQNIFAITTQHFKGFSPKCSLFPVHPLKLEKMH